MLDRFKDLFMRHPKEVGESYFGHMLVALTCAGKFWVLHVICIIHAFFPFLFTRTAGNWVKKMSNEISEKYEQ